MTITNVSCGSLTVSAMIAALLFNCVNNELPLKFEDRSSDSGMQGFARDCLLAVFSVGIVRRAMQNDKARNFRKAR